MPFVLVRALHPKERLNIDEVYGPQIREVLPYPGNSGDLLFAGTGQLVINNAAGASTGTGIVLAASGNFDANGSALTVGAVVSGAYSITVTGKNPVNLSGANTFSGGLTLNTTTGSLNINSATALGTGTFTIDAGTTFDNTSGSAIAESNNNVQVWNGSFTFGGTNSLDLGNGGVTANGAVTITTSTTTANTLTEDGVISDGSTPGTLTKAGTGTLVLTNGSIYTGGTTITVPVLPVRSDLSASTCWPLGLGPVVGCPDVVQSVQAV